MPYVRHRPEITHQIEDTPEGEALVWRMCCTCPSASPSRFRLRDAEADLEEHLVAVTPPPERACREPKKHRTQPHDFCPLCALQGVLPGFEHLTT